MKCAAHLGVLQVLEELGVRPTMLAGSSMGAVIAAIYASGLDLQDAAERLCCIRMSDVFVGGLPVPGLNHGRRLHQLFTRLFGDQRIEDLRVPLLITACDLISGATDWIDKGNLADALYASCALPGLFAPLAIGEALLGDGCLSDPLPVSELRNRGIRKVIGIHFPHTLGIGRRALLPLALRSIDILLNGLSRQAYQSLDLSIQPAVGMRSGLLWNHRQTRRCIEAGREAALQLSSELRCCRNDVEPGMATQPLFGVIAP